MTLDDARERMDAAQRRKLDCALKLHKEARAAVCAAGRKAKTDQEAADAFCTAGALAECYVATLGWMRELLEEAGDGPVSEDDAVAAWGRQHDWLVKNGFRLPVTRFDGVRRTALPFAALHAAVMECYRKVRAFRKEVKEGGAK